MIMKGTKPGRTAIDQATAVIYCRVSQDDERSGRSVGEQEAECRERATHKGWTVERVFDDNDISASRHSRKPRPNYEALVEFLSAGKADVLILWASSRGDRNLTRWSTLLDLCRTKGIKIHVLRDNRTYDLTYSRDWETLASDGVKNAAYVEEIRDAVMRAMRDNASEGKPHGRTPYGYTREYATIRGRQVVVRQFINTAQAEIIREAARRVANGETPYSVVKDFNARGIPSPANSRWDITKLKKIITNPAYIGKRIYIPKEDRLAGVTSGTLVDAKWPAILEDEPWQVCVDKLGDPARRTNRDTAIKHLLSGIATCGTCDSPMKAHTNNGYPVYMCKVNYCTSIPRAILEEYVESEVRQRLHTVTLSTDDATHRRQELLAEVEELQQRLEDIEAELKSAKGRSVARLTRIADELEDQIEDLQRQARSTKKLPIVAILTSNPEKWDSLSLPAKREFLRSGELLDGIEVLPVGKGFVRTPVSERVRITWTEDRLSLDPTS